MREQDIDVLSGRPPDNPGELVYMKVFFPCNWHREVPWDGG